MESVDYEIAQDRKIRRVMYCQATPAAAAARNSAAATKPLVMCDCVDVRYDV